jgi:hypothetical protein
MTIAVERDSQLSTTHLTHEEAAAYLRLSPAALHAMRSRGGAPPALRVGGRRGRLLYRRDAIDEWLSERVA